MTATLKTLGIDRMTVEERIQLIDEIWDSLGDEGDVPDWHRQELDRRIAAHEADPRRGSTWDEVKARLTNGGEPR